MLKTIKSCSRYHRLFNTVRFYSIESTPESKKVPKTFENQSLLPRLPIPHLENTLKLYESSLKPLYDGNEMKDISKILDGFLKNEGQVLQNRLISYDTLQKNSWLEDIWLNKGYLEYREPTLLNVNWWCEFKDHPKGLLKDVPKGSTTDFQIERAAGLVNGILNFNDALNREEVTPEYIKETPLCMNQYHHQIGTSRIALEKRDRIDSSYPCLAHHLVLSYKNQLVEVPVYGNNGERVTIETIIGQIQKAVAIVDSLPAEELQPPVGILTGEHRDTWAKARKSLESDKLNSSTLSSIDTSLFLLCLEDSSPSTDIDESHKVIFHNNTGENRWFDKAIQLIVTNNGRAGVNGEHTPADAVIPGRIFNEIVSNEPHVSPKGAVQDLILDEPKLLRWNINEETAALIKQAQVNVPAFISNIRSVLSHYSGFGSNLLKQLKVSPDAFVQMALQLAYYRQHGKVCPTYETASTRAFLHGRTETVRSCSVESKAFVEAFDSKDVSDSKKVELFQNAVVSHLNYMKKASRGQGVDRHLLGLRCMIEEGEETPQIFKHPSYFGSMAFRLSTSNMSPGKYFYGGFAPVVQDGYGLNYGIGKEDIKFSVSKWMQSKETDNVQFRSNVIKSFDDIASILKN